MRRLALTPGEPAGVGPDLCVQIAQQDLPAELVVFADPDLLLQRATRLGLPLDLQEFNVATPKMSGSGRLTLLPARLQAPATCGTPSPRNAGYVLETLRLAVEETRAGRLDALVTGPVHKGIINEGGFLFSGHTEYLADLCGAFPVMMLAAPGLRVALATTHLPLAQVSAAITRPLLDRVLGVLDSDLRTRFGISSPRILVCGLNPHAGEGGHLGREEIEIIEPALDQARSRGIRALGPLPADTLFTPNHLRQADAVLAMYHDQGLPVLKHLGFGRGVNITLGLPIIRTSVDHGTALDLACSGRADSGILSNAVQTALQLVDYAAGQTADGRLRDGAGPG